MPKMDAILQVRLKSTRLPEKAIKPILGKPNLLLTVERIQHSQLVKQVVIATSSDPADDPIQELCQANGISLYRGSEADVLDRIYQCAKHFGMDVFAKLTADNPLIDATVIDQVIRFYFEYENEVDYVSNNHPPTWPDGFEVEVIKFEALEKAWRKAQEPYQREHVTPYIWDQPELFRISNVALVDDNLYQQTRWTLDYPEDYEFVKRVYEELYPANPHFGMQDISDLLQRKPEIQQINAHLAAADLYSWYKDHLDGLKTVSKNALVKDL